MSSNSTEEEWWEPSLTDKLVVTVIFGSIIVTGVVGNVIVISLILFVRALRSTVNLCLASLALADLVVLIFLPTMPFLVLFTDDDSIMGPHYCVFISSIDRSAVVCAILIFVLIGVERYTVLCHPLKTLGMWTRSRVCVLLVIIWVVTIGVSIPFGYATKYEDFEYDNTTFTYCYVEWDLPWMKWYDFGITCVAFFLPIPFLIFLYGKMVITLKAQVPQSDAQGTGARLAKKARAQVVIMLVSVLVIFVLCLLPMRIYMILSSFFEDTLNGLSEKSHFQYNWFSRIVLYINHASNPIVYFLVSENFRKGFRVLFCKCYHKDESSAGSSSNAATETSRM